MRYISLIYLDDAVFAPMTQAQRDGYVNAMLDYDDDLRAGGHYVHSDGLGEIDTASSVRVRNGRIGITDGPFAETKEHLSGFHILEARDLNEALALAARNPLAAVGTVEIRPIALVERIETSAA